MDPHARLSGHRVLSLSGFEALINSLVEEGRRVLGPVATDGVITYSDVTSVADLPKGLRDQQAPGSYTLESSDTSLFGFASTAASWKPFLMPEPTLLIRASRTTDKTITIEQPEPEAPPTVFLGVRSCDLAAMGVLDDVVGDSAGRHNGVSDPTYSARRREAFVIAVACAKPSATCFCGSMGTGPTPTAGYDLVVHEICKAERHEFVIAAGSTEGDGVLDGIDSRAATTDDLSAIDAIHHEAAASMTRGIDPADPSLAASVPEATLWNDIAKQCLSCGNCTMVCPTCFCSTTFDTTDLTGTTSERWRSWDSCFTNDFTAIHGGAVRHTTASRYRQWLLHKVDRWHEQFGSSGCVGCGRCITWCPPGIDITAEVKKLAAVAREEG
ncbi:MAG: sulfite reductase subunit A [Actinomycetia bacterium]|nr:sulfite reductase subunit A [Actinomycetes bacterium]